MNAAFGIFPLSERPLDALARSGISPLLASASNGRALSGKIPEAAFIQLYLLRMSIVVLETCRGS
jgi:hypothetical protein